MIVGEEKTGGSGETLRRRKRLEPADISSAKERQPSKGMLTPERGQRDGAFKDATQVRVAAPPQGNRIKNSKFYILNFSDNDVFGLLTNSIDSCPLLE